MNPSCSVPLLLGLLPAFSYCPAPRVNCTFFPTVEGDLDQNLQAWETWKDAFVGTLELPNGEIVTIHEQKCVMFESLYRFSFNIEETYYEVRKSSNELIQDIHTTLL